MAHLQTIDWDFAERLQRVNKGGGGNVYFTYDASGQRVRKVYVHSGITEERIYLGGYEVYRRTAADYNLARQTLHVMDDQRRVAMVETKTVDTRSSATVPTTRWRFQLDNHLGSAILEVDTHGNIVSYEEYHPYGTSALRLSNGDAEVSAKRYRYTGKERDEETSLYYHGARYYAPWLGRWTAADPSGTVDGPNLYQYVSSNPIVRSDPTGRQQLEQGTKDDPVVAGCAGSECYFNIRQSRLEELQRRAAVAQQLETGGLIASNPLSGLFWMIARAFTDDPNKQNAAARLGLASFGVAASVGAAGAQRQQFRDVSRQQPAPPVAAQVQPVKPAEPTPIGPPPPPAAPPQSPAAPPPAAAVPRPLPPPAAPVTTELPERSAGAGPRALPRRTPSAPPAARPSEGTLRTPAARHYARRVGQGTLAKALNTVIEPGVDVRADVEAINAGRATRVNGNFVVNGRTYGAHDGTLYPISGTGFHQLTRAQFKALGVLNEFGETARSNEILGKMRISDADRAVAVRAYKATQ